MKFKHSNSIQVFELKVWKLYVRFQRHSRNKQSQQGQEKNTFVPGNPGDKIFFSMNLIEFFK